MKTAVLCKEDCTKIARARGWCSAHYEQARKEGRLPLSAKAKVLEWLELDGGWLSCDALAADLGLAVETVRRAVYRLREDGAPLEWRVVHVGHFSTPNHARTEWRHL